MNYQGGDYSDFQQQLQENERRWQQERSDEVTHNKNLSDSFNDDDAAHDKKIQDKADRDTQYRQDLKQQCEDNTQRSISQYNETRYEMKRIQESGHQMSEIFQSEVQQKHDDSKRLHDDNESFKKDCNDYRDMQKAMIDLEEQIINGQSHQMSDRTLAVETERNRKLQEKDNLNDRMCSQLEADEVDRQDREHDLEVRHNDEDQEKIRKEDIKAQEKWEEDRRELRDGLLSQIEENKQSVRDEKKRDMAYSDQACAVMELEEEREKERARKKKEADDQYYADLRQQIADNAVRRQKEKELYNS